MSIADKLPAEEVMREMSRIAMERATAYFAAKARELAKDIPPGCGGPEALYAFAKAIESTNAKVWPKGGQSA